MDLRSRNIRNVETEDGSDSDHSTRSVQETGILERQEDVTKDQGEGKKSEDNDMMAMLRKIIEGNAKMENKIIEGNAKMENNIKEGNAKMENKMEELKEGNVKMEKDLRAYMEGLVQTIKVENQQQMENVRRNITINRKRLDEVEKNMEMGFSVNLRIAEEENLKTNKEIRNHIKETNANIEKKMDTKIQSIEASMKQVKNTLEVEFSRKQTEYYHGKEKMVTMEEMRKIREEFEKKIEERNRLPVNKVVMGCQGDGGAKFEGDIKKLHPKIFMKILKNKIKYLQDYEDIREIIRNNLCGQALTWFNSREFQIDSFEQFEDYFFKAYWNETNQSLVREKLYFGKYDHNRNSSLSNYALSLYAQSQHFTPPIAEEEIIIFISRHFKPEISETIAIHNIKTFENLSAYLARVERSSNTKRINQNQGDITGQYNQNRQSNSNQTNNNNRHFLNNQNQNNRNMNYTNTHFNRKNFNNNYNRNTGRGNNNFGNQYPNYMSNYQNNNANYSNRQNMSYNETINSQNARRNSLDNGRNFQQQGRPENRQVNCQRKVGSVEHPNTLQTDNNSPSNVNEVENNPNF